MLCKWLTTFFEQLVGDPEFWEVPAGNDTYRSCVASAVADCLHSGTRNDDHAYMADLLPRTQALIAILLARVTSVDRPSDDAMMQAINTPKGRVVEALFSQALRACRLSDHTTGSHSDAWERVRPLFETELGKSRNANYEFSTLCGNYLAQLDYMDREWLKSHVERIFPSDYQSNSVCAIDGLAYAEFTRHLYELLTERGVPNRALRYELKRISNLLQPMCNLKKYLKVTNHCNLLRILVSRGGLEPPTR